MAECVVRDWQGKEAGKASLELKVAKETSAADLVHRAVVRQLAHARQGTASTLTRAEVRRWWPQALQAEGHRPRPSGFDPYTPPPRRWCDFRPQAAQLQPGDEPQGTSPGPAHRPDEPSR